MADLYSTSFWIAHDAVGDPAVEYFIPLGFIAVLRDWTVYNGNAGEDNYTLLSDVGPTVLWQLQFAAFSQGAAQWTGRIVLPGGSNVYANFPAQVDTTLSGYLLRAP